MFRDCALLASLTAVDAILTASAWQGANRPPLTMVNILTFSTAVMLPGITLAQGTYVFESGPGGCTTWGSPIRSCVPGAMSPAC
jgi:hypothetical protein